MTGFIYIFLLLAMASAKSDKKFKIVIDKVMLKSYNTEIVDELQGYAFQLNDRNYVNGQMRLNRMVNEFEFRWIMDIEKLNKQTVRIFDARMDGCTFLQGNHKSKVINNFLKSFKKFLSVDISCPLQPHINYTVNKLNLELTDMPTFMLFECKFHGWLEIIVEKQKVASAKYEGRVTSK